MQVTVRKKQVVGSTVDPSITDDRAAMEFDAFLPIGRVHIGRVRSRQTLKRISAVLDVLKNALTEQEKMLS